MNFQKLVQQLHKTHSLQAIADIAGLKSKSYIHDILTGKCKNLSYKPGARLIAYKGKK